MRAHSAHGRTCKDILISIHFHASFFGLLLCCFASLVGRDDVLCLNYPGAEKAMDIYKSAIEAYVGPASCID